MLNESSKHYNAYYEHILPKEEASNPIKKVYEIIDDLSDRRGLKQAWQSIDGEVQDEIIQKWSNIISSQEIKFQGDVLKINQETIINLITENDRLTKENSLLTKQISAIRDSIRLL